MYYIGLISGTSMDAVDAALVEFPGDGCRVVDYRQYPLPPELSAGLKAISAATSIHDLAGYDTLLGDLFAGSALDLADRAGIAAGEITAIGSHGQTVLHRPAPDIGNSLQIGDPNRIALLTGITTVADFRRMDMAAGGQGAPLAPCFHAWRFRDPRKDRAVVNIGGIGNVTLLPRDSAAAVIGFDTGPGNTLLDQWHARHNEGPYDPDGTWAAGGNVIEIVLERMLADEYFGILPPKSTGKDYFHLPWLAERLAAEGSGREPRDIQATLLELTCRTIADAIRVSGLPVTEVLVCGGGVHNGQVMRRLGELLAPAKVDTTAALGVDPDAVEAVTFAWLAKRRLEGEPGNLPSVTGARDAVLLGAVYSPGKGSKVKGKIKRI